MAGGAKLSIDQAGKSFVAMLGDCRVQLQVGLGKFSINDVNLDERFLEAGKEILRGRKLNAAFVRIFHDKEDGAGRQIEAFFRSTCGLVKQSDEKPANKTTELTVQESALIVLWLASQRVPMNLYVLKLFDGEMVKKVDLPKELLKTVKLVQQTVVTCGQEVQARMGSALGSAKGYVLALLEAIEQELQVGFENRHAIRVRGNPSQLVWAVNKWIIAADNDQKAGPALAAVYKQIQSRAELLLAVRLCTGLGVKVEDIGYLLAAIYELRARQEVEPTYRLVEVIGIASGIALVLQTLPNEEAKNALWATHSRDVAELLKVDPRAVHFFLTEDASIPVAIQKVLACQVWNELTSLEQQGLQAVLVDSPADVLAPLTSVRAFTQVLQSANRLRTARVTAGPAGAAEPVVAVGSVTDRDDPVMALLQVIPNQLGQAELSESALVEILCGLSNEHADHNRWLQAVLNSDWSNSGSNREQALMQAYQEQALTTAEQLVATVSVLKDSPRALRAWQQTINGLSVDRVRQLGLRFEHLAQLNALGVPLHPQHFPAAFAEFEDLHAALRWLKDRMDDSAAATTSTTPMLMVAVAAVDGQQATVDTMPEPIVIQQEQLLALTKTHALLIKTPEEMQSVWDLLPDTEARLALAEAYWQWITTSLATPAATPSVTPASRTGGATGEASVQSSRSGSSTLSSPPVGVASASPSPNGGATVFGMRFAQEGMARGVLFVFKVLRPAEQKTFWGRHKEEIKSYIKSNCQSGETVKPKALRGLMLTGALPVAIQQELAIVFWNELTTEEQGRSEIYSVLEHHLKEVVDAVSDFAGFEKLLGSAQELALQCQMLALTPSRFAFDPALMVARIKTLTQKASEQIDLLASALKSPQLTIEEERVALVTYYQNTWFANKVAAAFTEPGGEDKAQASAQFAVAAEAAVDHFAQLVALIKASQPYQHLMRIWQTVLENKSCAHDLVTDFAKLEALNGLGLPLHPKYFLGDQGAMRDFDNLHKVLQWMLALSKKGVESRQVGADEATVIALTICNEDFKVVVQDRIAQVFTSFVDEGGVSSSAQQLQKILDILPSGDCQFSGAWDYWCQLYKMSLDHESLQKAKLAVLEVVFVEAYRTWWKSFADSALHPSKKNLAEYLLPSDASTESTPLLEFLPKIALMARPLLVNYCSESLAKQLTGLAKIPLITAVVRLLPAGEGRVILTAVSNAINRFNANQMNNALRDILTVLSCLHHCSSGAAELATKRDQDCLALLHSCVSALKDISDLCSMLEFLQTQAGRNHLVAWAAGLVDSWATFLKLTAKVGGRRELDGPVFWLDPFQFRHVITTLAEAQDALGRVAQLQERRKAAIAWTGSFPVTITVRSQLALATALVRILRSFDDLKKMVACIIDPKERMQFLHCEELARRAAAYKDLTINSYERFKDVHSLVPTLDPRDYIGLVKQENLQDALQKVAGLFPEASAHSGADESTGQDGAILLGHQRAEAVVDLLQQCQHLTVDKSLFDKILMQFQQDPAVCARLYLWQPEWILSKVSFTNAIIKSNTTPDKISFQEKGAFDFKGFCSVLDHLNDPSVRGQWALHHAGALRGYNAFVSVSARAGCEGLDIVNFPAAIVGWDELLAALTDLTGEGVTTDTSSRCQQLLVACLDRVSDIGHLCQALKFLQRDDQLLLLKNRPAAALMNSTEAFARVTRILGAGVSYAEWIVHSNQLIWALGAMQSETDTAKWCLVESCQALIAKQRVFQSVYALLPEAGQENLLKIVQTQEWVRNLSPGEWIQCVAAKGDSVSNVLLKQRTQFMRSAGDVAVAMSGFIRTNQERKKIPDYESRVDFAQRCASLIKNDDDKVKVLCRLNGQYAETLIRNLGWSGETLYPLVIQELVGSQKHASRVESFRKVLTALGSVRSVEANQDREIPASASSVGVQDHFGAPAPEYVLPVTWVVVATGSGVVTSTAQASSSGSNASLA